MGVEVKRADGPKVTQSMRIALADLRLERLVVVYPGERAYRVWGGSTAEWGARPARH